jgi:adenylate kinase family enzyme
MAAPMGFIVLTGASGSGKTEIAQAIASRYGEYVDVYHFDRIVYLPQKR